MDPLYSHSDKSINLLSCNALFEVYAITSNFDKRNGTCGTYYKQTVRICKHSKYK